ncbi:unnamed protein product, partial [Polarella glacialis]
ARSQEWERALVLLLEDLPRRRLTPSAISLGIALRACEAGGQWLKALELLEFMAEARIALTAAACTSAVGACAQSGDWSRSLWLFAQARRRDLEPDDLLYTAVIGACPQAEQITLLLEDMQRSGLAPNPAVLAMAAEVAAGGEDPNTCSSQTPQLLASLQLQAGVKLLKGRL